MVSKIDNIPPIASEQLGSSYTEDQANRLVADYINSLEISRNSPPPSSIDDFCELVQNAVRSKENQENVPEDKRLLLLEDDPPEAIDTEAITWYLKARAPGRFDQGPSGAGAIKEVVGHVRSVLEHPEHPGEKLISMGKFYSNWVSFNIYARTSKQAMKRLLWFEKLMDGFHWYFRVFGFRVIEEGVGEREKVEIKGLELVKYPVVYFVRSDDTYNVTSQELKKILVETKIF